MTDQEICGACDGSRRMPRDPDIGTDQECFVCDGSGVIDANSRADQLVRKYIECLVTNDPDGASDATKSMVDYVFNCQPATAHEAKAAPAVPQGLPAFDELDDEVIDAACTLGSLYRVDLMRAYECIRTMLAATPSAPSQPVTLTDEWPFMTPHEVELRLGRQEVVLRFVTESETQQACDAIIAALREKGGV